MKPCTHCRRILPLEAYYKYLKTVDRYYGACKACHKDTIKRARGRDPARYKAMTVANRAVRDGTLLKRPCKVCGNVAVRAYHPDYSKPLEVEWVCFPHYREIVFKKSLLADPK